MEGLGLDKLVGLVVAVLVGVNLVLSGLSKLLELVKDKTKTDADNKAYAVLQKLLAFIAKVLDWAQGNREHK